MASRRRIVPNPTTGALPATNPTVTRKRTTHRVTGRAKQWAMGQKADPNGLDALLYETLQISGCLNTDVPAGATQTIIRQFLTNAGVAAA